MRADPVFRHALTPFVMQPVGRGPGASARSRALLAGAAGFAGAVMLVVLHVLPGNRDRDPMSPPLSEYALRADGWLFDLAMLALAFGLAALTSALVRSQCLARRSPARGLLTACSLSLVLVAVFPEHAPNGSVQLAGRIHWVATMLAFGGLAVVPGMLGRHRGANCSRLTSRARRLVMGIGPGVMLALSASLMRYDTTLPVPPWLFGTVERGVVLLDFVLAGVLTAWAWRGCACRLTVERQRVVANAASSVAPSESRRPVARSAHHP